MRLRVYLNPVKYLVSIYIWNGKLFGFKVQDTESSAQKPRLSLHPRLKAGFEALNLRV